MLDDAITGELGVADVAVLERYGDPRTLLRAGRARLLAVIRKASRGHHGAERADAWLAVARSALISMAMTPRCRSPTSPPRWQPKRGCCARCSQSAIFMPTTARPPIAPSTLTGWPAAFLVSPRSAARCSSRRWATRTGFTNAAAFKRFSGLTPKASETGNTDRKGQAISKAGPRRLRDQLVQSANTARRIDPQLAEVYFTQMVERGAHHQKALCVVAARLAERAWVVLARREPYVLRDRDGTPVSAAEAKALIAERYQVPEDVRRRRRSRKKAGKAPHQVLEAHAISHPRHHADNRGNPPRITTTAQHPSTIKTPASTPSTSSLNTP